MYGCMCTLFNSDFTIMKAKFKIETSYKQNVGVLNDIQ